MSLDGFIAGSNDGPELPLGEGGERLHEWVYNLASWRERHSLDGGETNRDAEILDELQLHLLPVLLGAGRRLFEQIGTERIELESTRMIESPGVTHIKFRVVK